MNKQLLVSTSLSILAGTFSFSQPSLALDMKKIADPMLKRGICAVLGVNTGECAPEQLYPQSPVYTPPTNYPNYPQNPSTYPNIPEYPQNPSSIYNDPNDYPQTYPYPYSY